MEFLVIGGNGLLGRALMRYLENAGRTAASASRSLALRMDITSPASIAAGMDAVQPRLVILAAAATSVDELQADPDLAFRVNALGARHVAEECRRRGLPLTYISTDYVFDGKTDTPYTEFDVPSPISVYGSSKLAGERYVLGICPGSQVIRIAGLYGPDGPCFPAKALQAGLEGRPLRLISDWRHSWTSARQAARCIIDIASRRLPGTYHAAGGGGASPFEVGVRALASAGLAHAEVQAVAGSSWNTPAPRPHFSELRPYVLQLEGQPLPDPWQDEIDAFARVWRESHPRY